MPTMKSLALSFALVAFVVLIAMLGSQGTPTSEEEALQRTGSLTFGLKWSDLHKD